MFQRILGSSSKFQVPVFCNHILLTVTPRSPWQQKAHLSLMSSRPSCYAKDAVALWLLTCAHACSWPPLWLPTKSPKPVLTTLRSVHTPHYGSHYSQGTSDCWWPDPKTSPAQHLKHIYPTNQGHSLQSTSHSYQCCTFIHTHHPTSIPLCTLDKFLLISPELAFSEKLSMTTRWAHSSPGWPLGQSLMHGLNCPTDLCPQPGSAWFSIGDSKLSVTQ